MVAKLLQVNTTMVYLRERGARQGGLNASPAQCPYILSQVCLYVLIVQNKMLTPLVGCYFELNAVVCHTQEFVLILNKGFYLTFFIVI